MTVCTRASCRTCAYALCTIKPQMDSLCCRVSSEAGIGGSDAWIWTTQDLLNCGRVPLGLAPLVDKQRADAFHKVGPGGAAVVHHAELHPEAVRQRPPSALSDLPQGHLLRQGRQPAPQRIQIKPPASHPYTVMPCREQEWLMSCAVLLPALVLQLKM